MPAALSAMVSLVRVSFSLATAPRSPALISGTFVCVLPCSCDQVAEPLGRALRRVLHRRVGFQRALIDAEHRDAAGELIGDRLPHERGVRRLLVGALRTTSAPDASSRLERPLGRRRHVGDDGVEQRLRADVRPRPTRTPAETPSRSCVAFFRPAISSSCVSVPASKNFSISCSSASATISIERFARGVGRVGHVGGDRALGHLAGAVGRRTCTPSS